MLEVQEVVQEPVILNMSIKDNIMYSNDYVKFEDVIQLCKELGIKVMQKKRWYAIAYHLQFENN